MAKTLLRMEQITKKFSGVPALHDVNFDVQEGEIHALVGENGAGKSTLMNVLSGVYPFGEYEGNIVYDGEVCKFAGIRDSEAKGIAIIHQELALVPLMSIGENMFLGHERGRKIAIDWDRTWSEAAQHMADVGLTESPRTLIKDISVGKQQLVEIAKALAKKVRLLILDEPTASLNEDDSQKLLALLVQLKGQGMTSILISHKLSEVNQVADRITILRDGGVIETLTKGEDDIGEGRIIKGMVGRELKDRFPPRESAPGDVCFEIRDWTVWHPLYERKTVDNVTIKVREGEVVGLSGLMGAGRSELCMSVFGRLYGRDATGKVFLDGQEAHLDTVKEAIARKVAYVTEDRKQYGLVLPKPIRVNVTLASMDRVSRNAIIDEDKERVLAADFTKLLGVKCSGIEQEVGSLSGGNQQKVLLSKWMFAEPKILILDEPTRGIDVGAKYDIYNFINNNIAQRKSVLMISSEMPEILGMCDRIYVMNEGRIVAEFKKGEASQEAIMGAILRDDAERGGARAKAKKAQAPAQ